MRNPEAAPLPTLDQMYNTLRTHGDIFPLSDAYQAPIVEGFMYDHPEQGRQPVRIDERVLAATPNVYVGDEAMAQALREHGANNVQPMTAAEELIRRYFTQDHDDIIWGFSGYASVVPGIDYETEAVGLDTLYNHFADWGIKPTLAIDGASREGVLGLNSVIAQKYNVPTLGFASYEGLANFVPHRNLVIAGNAYPDRERLVALADIVFATAGGDGTRRECEYAARHGSTIGILKLKEYPPNSFVENYTQSPIIQKAAAENRLFVCESLDDIPATVIKMIDSAIRTNKISRENRAAALQSLLESPDKDAKGKSVGSIQLLASALSRLRSGRRNR